MSDLVEGEELHDTDSDTRTADDYAEEVKKSSEQNCLARSERVGVDDWSYSIGGVVETVDELKSTYECETESGEEKSEIHIERLGIERTHPILSQ
jgi:hypothetical protein